MESTEAILARPQTPLEVRRHLDSARGHLSVLRELAGDFAALDVRPLRIVGGTVERIGEFDLPENLSAALHDAAIEVARLEHRLHDMLTART